MVLAKLIAWVTKYSSRHNSSTVSKYNLFKLFFVDIFPLVLSFQIAMKLVKNESNVLIIKHAAEKLFELLIEAFDWYALALLENCCPEVVDNEHVSS